MKKITLLFVLFLGILLSSCASEMKGEEEPSYLDDYITYNYEKGTFNDSYEESILYGIYDYELEFYFLLNLAYDQNAFSRTLSQEEKDAYNNLFQKLEQLDKHYDNIFTLSSNDLKALLEAEDIEVEAIDIFAFNGIKSIFEEVNYIPLTIKVYNYLPVFSDGTFPENVEDGLPSLFEYQYGVIIYQESDKTIDLVTVIEDTYQITLDETEKMQIQAAYDYLESIKE